MTEEQAKQIHSGSEVIYRGVRCKVNSVALGDIAGPHFRLSPVEPCAEPVERDIRDGLTSYILCGVVD